MGPGAYICGVYFCGSDEIALEACSNLWFSDFCISGNSIAWNFGSGYSVDVVVDVVVGSIVVGAIVVLVVVLGSVVVVVVVVDGEVVVEEVVVEFVVVEVVVVEIVDVGAIVDVVSASNEQ